MDEWGAIKCCSDRDMLTPNWGWGDLPMQKVSLGQDSPELRRSGCTGMSSGYGPAGDLQKCSPLSESGWSGFRFFDTAEVYGPSVNRELSVRRWLFRGKVDRD
jgi:aryl-alcohol dehydrogenase-like predicted oxidoreductase